MPVPVTLETAVEYLVDRGLVSPSTPARSRSLGGGVSNRVTLVTWSDGRVVVKQPRPNLAVEADWPADPDRVHTEAAAARTWNRVLDGRVIVPAVLDEDRARHVAVFEAAPDRYVTWKERLLAGHVDASIATTLGEVLGTVHRAATEDPSARKAFRSNRPFVQLRLDPYHRATAAAHPELAAAIDAERERIAAVDRTLVHGDYSPKNVLVDPEDDGRPWIIDFEVAHWGDPAFDVAFLLNHLLIKSMYRPRDGPAYRQAARAAFDAYDAVVPWDVERETVRELGVLLLARIDGKSPVEYVTEEATKETIRSVARHVILEEVDRLDDVVAAAAEAVDG